MKTEMPSNASRRYVLLACGSLLHVLRIRDQVPEAADAFWRPTVLEWLTLTHLMSIYTCLSPSQTFKPLVEQITRESPPVETGRITTMRHPVFISSKVDTNRLSVFHAFSMVW
jgi:hypothetical protein